MTLLNNQPQKLNDPWRQKFHLCPPGGLLNDPNGLIYWRGAYHVFFQWNPHECAHGYKAWGHACSTDLISWEYLPVALTPDEAYETHGCYSGSAVCDGDKLYLIYTGNVRTADGGRQSYQCLAHSSDGIRFVKQGPVIDSPQADYTAHFRDPKVWRGDDEWLMVLGAQTVDEQGTVLLFRSPDLVHWHMARPLIAPGEQGFMCECPDLFSLDGSDILLTSAQRMVECDGGPVQENTSGYVAGKFSAASGQYAHGEFRPLDYGPDCYAPQTFATPFSERLMLAWMGRPEVDTAPSVAHGWLHCLSLPRCLSWDGKRLLQRPAVALQRLRKRHVEHRALALFEGLALAELRGETYELALSFATPPASSWSVDMRCGEEEFTRLSYFAEQGALVLDCRFAGAGAGGVSSMPLTDGKLDSLRIFVDRSSIEVFANDGEGVLSARIYPAAGSDGICFHAKGVVMADVLQFWEI